MSPLSRRTLLGSAAAAALRAAAPPKSILILGGTNFLGPAVVEAAQAHGHRVTLFNRGRTRPGLFPGLEKLQGDRDPNKGEGLKALEGRSWDVVLDNSGYYLRMVSASATLLGPRVRQYIYISSISAYANESAENSDESARLATMPDPTIEDMGPGFRNFGPLKALCEQAAESAMPGRVTVIRPGYIVGPDDPTGRFTYWPVRIDRGGEVAAPGAPADPVQFIDVRDLGAWIVRVAEQNTTGIFNATGPARRMLWGHLLAACEKAGSGKSKLTWLPASFLDGRDDAGFPIWAPYTGETRGAHTHRNARALKAGLQLRPAAATVRDTLAWYKSQPPQGRVKLAGPTPEQEAALLAAWRARKS